MNTNETDSDKVPYVGSHDLNWSMVRKGSDNALDVFWAYWSLYAICFTSPDRKDRANEFLDLAQRVASECPEKWRGCSVRPSDWSHSPKANHERMLELSCNPAGLEFWISMIGQIQGFGFFVAEIVRKTKVITGFKPNMLELMGGANAPFIRHLTDHVIQASPYTDSFWITAELKEASVVIKPITRLPDQLKLPPLDTKARGVRWLVVNEDGSHIGHFIPAYDGPIRYA